MILSRPRDYMKQVFAWQGVGWLFRFAAFWFFLEAFGLKGSIGNVMLVMSVQAIANIVPFTPGGAGAQQALLVATLKRPLARRRPLLLGRHPDRDGRLVGPPRLRRDPPRLPHHRLARPDPPGPGGRRPRGRRRPGGAGASAGAARRAESERASPRLRARPPSSCCPCAHRPMRNSWRGSVRPAGVAGFDVPLPRRGFGGGEVVVVAAGEGLEGDQGGVLGREDLGAGGGFDVGRGRGAADGAPAEGRAVLPVDDLDRAVGAAVVDQLGEVGGAAVGGGQVGAGGDGAALAAAAAEVDRDERQAVGAAAAPRAPGRARGRGGRAASRRRGRAAGGGRRPAGAGRRRCGGRSRAPVPVPPSTSPPPAIAAITATSSSAISAASPALSIVACPRSRARPPPPDHLLASPLSPPLRGHEPTLGGKCARVARSRCQL